MDKEAVTFNVPKLSSPVKNLTDDNNNMMFAARLGGVHVPVEEMALTSSAQIRKLELILEELDKRLGPQDGSGIKWNVKRESCSWLSFQQEATSQQQTFCSSGTDFDYKQDLVLAQGCHVQLHQLWGDLAEIEYTGINFLVSGSK